MFFFPRDVDLPYLSAIVHQLAYLPLYGVFDRCCRLTSHLPDPDARVNMTFPNETWALETAGVAPRPYPTVNDVMKRIGYSQGDDTESDDEESSVDTSTSTDSQAHPEARNGANDRNGTNAKNQEASTSSLATLNSGKVTRYMRS